MLGPASAITWHTRPGSLVTLRGFQILRRSTRSCTCVRTGFISLSCAFTVDVYSDVQDQVGVSCEVAESMRREHHCLVASQPAKAVE